MNCSERCGTKNEAELNDIKLSEDRILRSDNVIVKWTLAGSFPILCCPPLPSDLTRLVNQLSSIFWGTL